MSDKTFQANIYTPDWRFIAVLNDYISIVWTDRYYDLGDFELVLPLTKENLQIYSPDNYIICNQSDKVMIIEEVSTATSADGYKMQVKGHSAESLLKRRVVPSEFICNASTNNVAGYTINLRQGGTKNSHFVGALLTLFEKSFSETVFEFMSEAQHTDATIWYGDPSHFMHAIRFAGVISDPFNHIADAVANVSTHGDEYFNVLQNQCEGKDIGFAVYRNFEVPINRDTDFDKDKEVVNAGRISQANTSGLFDLVLYDGYNRTSEYLKENGQSMQTEIDGKLYNVPNGVVFSVEYLNLASSDSLYSKENYKNYIFVKGGEVADGGAEVDVAEATANFTKRYSGENPKYYQVGTGKNVSGIFRRETFVDSNLNRGSNTRKKYSDRLKASGNKELKKYKEELVLSCEISNPNDYIYRDDYYLGDLVTVKDSMDNTDVFRVTEEIISSDANGLKIYPTLVKFDPDKYISDDSIDEVDTAPKVEVEFLFNDDNARLGSLPDDTDPIINLYVWLYSTTSKGPYISNWPDDTEPGTIIDTIPSVDSWVRSAIVNNSDTPNLEILIRNLKGVVTFQKFGDYIVFPHINGDAIIGTPNTDPNEDGDYKLINEQKDLRYWESYRRFVPYQESLGEENGVVCDGYERFNAHWSPKYCVITYEHGDGGEFKYFSNSYCKIDEAYSSPPSFNSIRAFERKRDWNQDAYVYKRLYSKPIGWDVPGSSTYYDHYYIESKPTDKIFQDCAIGSKPYPQPTVYALPNYIRESPAWSPNIVPATGDATYTAQWRSKNDDPNDEDGDDDWGDDDNSNREEPRSPVKHKVQKSVYVGGEEKDVVDSHTALVSFVHTSSRIGDDFKVQDGHMVKVKDGKTQHQAFLYKNDIGHGSYLQAYWRRYGMLPGITILRGDGQCMAEFGYSGDASLLDINYGSQVSIVSFTNTPSVKAIKGLKALSKNPLAHEEGSDEPEWPNNIYDRSNHHITSKPSDWDSNWRSYCYRTQIGGKYGIYCCGCDDMGIMFNPLWVRLGIIDWPIVPLVSGSIPYDLKYTANALDIAHYVADPIDARGNLHYTKYFYNQSGWVWVEIPDYRWDAPARGTGLVPVSGEAAPEFLWTDKYGSLYFKKNQNGTFTGLTQVPTDWDTNYSSYYMSTTNDYAPIEKYTGHFAPSDISVWIPSSRFYGESYRGWDNEKATNNIFEGCSEGSYGAVLPKNRGSTNSIIVSIIGYTQSQHVKPGEVATFKVNAISLVLGADLSYLWEIQDTGSSEWRKLGVGGSSYSFTASESSNGYHLRCLVTASYTVFGETVTGHEYTGTMFLVVDEYGTDGKQAPDDPTKKEDEKTKKEASESEKDPQSPPSEKPTSGSEAPSYAPLQVNGNGYYIMPQNEQADFVGANKGYAPGTYSFQWTGGDPPDMSTAPWVDAEGIIHGGEGWEYISNSRKPYGSGGSGGNVYSLNDVPISGTIEEQKEYLQDNYSQAAYNYGQSTQSRVTDTEIEVDTGIKVVKK